MHEIYWYDNRRLWSLVRALQPGSRPLACDALALTLALLSPASTNWGWIQMEHDSESRWRVGWGSLILYAVVLSDGGGTPTSCSLTLKPRQKTVLAISSFVPDSLAIIWTTGPSCRSLASLAIRMLSPSSTSLPSSPFILHLYLLDWKRPGTAQLLPWEKEQSSYQPEAQMYCTGLCSPAESTKCFRRDTQTDLCCLILVAGDVRRLRWKKNLSLALIKGTGCFSALMHVSTVR